MRGEVGVIVQLLYAMQLTTKINVERRSFLIPSAILFDIVSRDFKKSIIFCQIHFSEEEERRKSKGRKEE
jgi:hypothetical protein